MKKRILFVLLCFFLSSCTFVVRMPFDPPKEKKPHLYRGVYHVHSDFSHDSKASLNYISKTAKKAGLDFVVLTDHNNDEAKKHLKLPENDEPLLIVGTEISTWYDGHLVVLGASDPPFSLEHTSKIVDLAHQQGGYVIPAHPHSKRKPWTNWEIPFDGIEIFSFSDFIYERKVLDLVFKVTFFPASSFLKSMIAVNPKSLELWDHYLSTGKRLPGFGSVDAHLKYALKNFPIDNYLMAFQAVTMYVTAEAKTPEKIIESLMKGKSFIAFEVFGHAHEFSFSVSENNELNVRSPQPAHIKLIHNGKVVAEERGNSLIYQPLENGYYRSEVYLDDRLWIISNPIYVEEKPVA